MSRIWKTPAPAALLLLAVACASPPERPRAGFRWPDGWPDPTAECADPAMGKGGRGELAALSTALRAGRLGEAERRWRDLGGGRRPVPEPVVLAGAEIAFLRQDAAESVARSGAGREGECWALRFVRAEGKAATGDLEGAWGTIRSIRGEEAERPAVRESRERIGAARIESQVRVVDAGIAAGNLDEARKLAGRLVIEHPRSRLGYLAAARVALASRDVDAALAVLGQGLAVLPADRELLSASVESAAGAGRWQEALDAAEALAKVDPSTAPKLEAIRAKWSMANAPEGVRRAAETTRLSRLDLAVLLWWQVPEIRSIPVDEPPIASDVLDRPEKAYIIRALALGLWNVDPVSHAAKPETAVGRRELAGMLARLAELLAPGRPLPGRGGWVPPAPEGAAAPDRVDGGTAISALESFRRDVFGRPR